MTLNTLKFKIHLPNTGQMLRLLIPLQLAFFALFTLAALGAEVPSTIPSQETIDAVQNMKIYALESKLDTNTTTVEELHNQFGLMRSSMDRFTGIGIGLGCALTMLQALQLILNLKLNTKASQRG